jgi:hypothetical protein
MVIWPLWLASPASHVVTGVSPRAMFTSIRISSTVTLPSSLQSPAHGFGVDVGGTVCVGVLVAVAVLVGVLVGAGVFVGVAVGVAVGVGVFVGVCVDVLVGVRVGVTVGV